ncbi:MAG: hypothetical protein VKL59_11305 [Nostocaceae cyanobacterium]|nr:hypothetical protein [Nostocaceae cyanobacterium]
MLDYSFRQFKFDEERLYNHWLDLRIPESPDQLIQRFHCLFIDGLDYPDGEILSAVNNIVLSDWADEEFKFILNRCCYSLINYWLLYLEDTETPIADLVALFHDSSYLAPRCYATKRLRELVRNFLQTQEYKSLQRRARVANPNPKPDTEEPANNIPLANLIPRYPFLYPYCLLDHDSSEMGTEAVKHWQLKCEKQYEQNLSQYLHYLRRSRHRTSASTIQVKNPTLLRDEALDNTIRHFVGKVEGSQTYKDLASQCSVYIRKSPTYGVVKGHIYDYLTSAIDPKYGRRSFNPWLAKQLKNIQYQSDMLPCSDYLVEQTCGQLLNAILASPDDRSDNHVKFIDITHNVDVHLVVGMLLKIVLLCRNIQSSLETVKSHVSRKFAGMFKYYETQVRGKTEWLVKSLEYWLIALTVQFGRMDFSWVNVV